MKEKEKASAEVVRLTNRRARKAFLEKRIVELYLQGSNSKDIAAEIRNSTGEKIGELSVTKAISKAISEWIQTKAEMIEHHKAIELAKINKLEVEYWTAYFRSCEVSKNKSTEKVKGKTGKGLALSKVTESERVNLGDSKFLDGIQWCIEMRCKILGLEAPVKTESVNNTTVTHVRRVTFAIKPASQILHDGVGSTSN